MSRRSRSRPQPGTRGLVSEGPHIEDSSQGLTLPAPQKWGSNPGANSGCTHTPPSSCGGPGQGPSICHPSGQTASPLQDSAPISKRQGLEKMKSSLPEFQQFLSTGLGEPLEDTPNVGQKGWGRNQLGKWLRPRGHNGPRTFLGLLLVSLRAPSEGPPCPEHLADAGCAQSVPIFEEAVRPACPPASEPECSSASCADPIPPAQLLRLSLKVTPAWPPLSAASASLEKGPHCG